MYSFTTYFFVLILPILGLGSVYSNFSAILPGQNSLTPAQQVNNRFVTNPTTGITKVTALTKQALPAAAQQGASNSFTSFFKVNLKKNHPSGSQLFPDDARLGTLLDTFLNGVAKKPDFLPYFSKIHLIILHELYIYLTSVYATFSVTHNDTVESYLATQKAYALNEKMLIVFHLISLIEAQLNQAIRARLPGMPKNIASYTGTLMVKHDYGNDVTFLINETEAEIIKDANAKTLVKAERDAYINLYGAYLIFFNAYTQTLEESNKTPLYQGMTTFLAHAQTIVHAVKQDISGIEFGGGNKKNLQRSIDTLNPPLFFYEDSVMRSLRIIPLLAHRIPAKAQAVPWPQCVVENALNNTQARTNFVVGSQNSCGKSSTSIEDEGIPLGYPIAYFAHKNDGSQALYMNIPLNNNSNNHIYAQELKQQPPWLNTGGGVLLMLRACLGDFVALLDPLLAKEDIIDPFLACITYNAATKVGLKVPASNSCQICGAFIKGINSELAANTQSITIPSLPDAGGMPQMPIGSLP